MKNHRLLLINLKSSFSRCILLPNPYVVGPLSRLASVFVQSARMNCSYFASTSGLQHHLSAEPGDCPHHGAVGLHEDTQCARRYRCEQHTHIHTHNLILSYFEYWTMNNSNVKPWEKALWIIVLLIIVVLIIKLQAYQLNWLIWVQ